MLRGGLGASRGLFPDSWYSARRGWWRRLMADGWWFGLGGFVLLRQRRWFKCGFQTRRRRRQCGEALQERFANSLCLSKFASVGPTWWNSLVGLLLPRLSDEPVRTCSCWHRDAVTIDVLASGGDVVASGWRLWGLVMVYVVSFLAGWYSTSPWGGWAADVGSGGGLLRCQLQLCKDQGLRTSSALHEADMPVAWDGCQRAAAHAVAEEVGLKHESAGARLRSPLFEVSSGGQPFLKGRGITTTRPVELSGGRATLAGRRGGGGCIRLVLFRPRGARESRRCRRKF